MEGSLHFSPLGEIESTLALGSLTRDQKSGVERDNRIEGSEYPCSHRHFPLLVRASGTDPSLYLSLVDSYSHKSVAERCANEWVQREGRG